VAEGAGPDIVAGAAGMVFEFPAVVFLLVVIAAEGF
jgi:hypothetical protein